MPSERWFTGILVCAIVLLHLWNGQHTIVRLRPQSVHQWAQCDRAAVALNYYQYGFNFFKPQVHNLDNGTGITGMEFPIINYTVAILYKIFGYHEFIYRLLELLIFSMGLLCAFTISFYYTMNKWMSMAIMLIFGAIPLLSFYAANFLPDIVSLSLLLMAWTLLIKAIQKPARKYFILAFTGLWLACLIKITSLIYLPAFMYFILLNFRKQDRKTVAIRLIVITGILVSLTLPWYYYASWLSSKTYSEVFLLQFMPLTSVSEFMDVYKEVSEVWLDRLFLIPITLFLFFFPVVFAMIPGLNKEMKWMGLILLSSVMIFMLLMWQQFRHHDYYMIMICPLFLISIIQLTMVTQYFKLHKGIIIALLFVLSVFNSLRASNYLNLVYDRSQWYYGSLHFDNYFDFENSLREMNVSSEVPVISVFDHSPDISLYLMNQKGVTVSYRKTELTLQKYIDSGAFQYLIYDPSSNFEKIAFDDSKYPVTLEKEIYGIKVFRVNNFREGMPVPAFKLSPWN